jgi:hypothetical protein
MGRGVTGSWRPVVRVFQPNHGPSINFHLLIGTCLPVANHFVISIVTRGNCHRPTPANEFKILKTIFSRSGFSQVAVFAQFGSDLVTSGSFSTFTYERIPPEEISSPFVQLKTFVSLPGIERVQFTNHIPLCS